MAIILASASPRRSELLRQAGLDFDICPSSCDEQLPAHICPNHAVLLLARRKALSVLHEHPNDLIIGADTLVAYQNRIFGKPKDEQDAFEILRFLSDKTHQVLTGVCIASSQGSHTFYVKTDVTFYPLTDAMIREYIAGGEPMDKAGAYGIQGKGALLVKAIKGDYNNVVGLPLAETVRRLNVRL